MKTFASVMLVATAFAGLVNAGWNPEQPPNYTVSAYCANTNAERACFTTDIGDLTPGAGSHFSGFISGDNKSFVVYKDTDSTASLVVGRYIININWATSGNDGQTCCAVDVQTQDGQDVSNYLSCAQAKWFNLSA